MDLIAVGLGFIFMLLPIEELNRSYFPIDGEDGP
jgi:hypothetical protein